MTGDVEEAVLEIYLSGISVRKIAGVTNSLSRVRIGKDAVSRIVRRLEEEQRAWRERPLKEKAYSYLYLDATYLKVRWGRASPTWRSCGVWGWTRRAFGRGAGSLRRPRGYKVGGFGRAARWEVAEVRGAF